MITLGLSLLSVGIGFFVRVYQLDRELRAARVIRIEPLHRPTSELVSPAEQIESMLRVAVPAHWLSDTSREDGRNPSAELWLFLSLGWCFAVVGLMILAGDA